MDNETLGAALALAKKTLADPALIEEKVNDWLDDHPEATTTVQDGAISYSKLDSSLKETADEVSQLSNAITSLENVVDGMNAYDEVISGNSIDVSDYAGETIPKVTSEINVSSAATEFKLYCCGKNHCMVPNDTVTQYGLTRTWNSDGTITLSGKPDRNVTISLGTKLDVYNTAWRFSIQKSSENAGVNLKFNGQKYSESFNWDAFTTGYFNDVSLQIDVNTTLDNYVVRPMLEFAPYSETIVYEAFSGFIKTYMFDEAVTSGIVDWGSIDIPENADTLWMYETGCTTTIYEEQSAGERIDNLEEEVETLVSDVDGAYAHEWVVDIDGWTDPSISYTSGGYINSSGQVVSNGSFRYSGFIPCEAGDMIYYNLYGYSSTVYIVTFYNASKERISGIVGQSDYKSGTEIAPANTKYVVFSSDNNTNIGTFSISKRERMTGDENAVEIKRYADSLVSVSSENVVLTRGDVRVVIDKVYTNQGDYTLTNGRRTDYIPVSEGDTVKYRVYNYIGTSVKLYAIAVFNSSKTLIDHVEAETTGWTSGTYTIPENGAYLVVTWEMEMRYDGWFEITLANYTQALAEIVELSQNVPNTNLKGKQWCCLGDSITYGANTTNVYHKFIGERCAITAYNFGESNTAIAKSSASVTNNMATRYTDMYDDVDYITVFGGTNDHGQNIPIGQWGDTEQTTLYGAMKVLCEGLVAKYIGKKIGFILPLPKYASKNNVYYDFSYPNESFTPYVECIHDVCKRYSIPVLNLYLESGLAVGNSDVRTAMIPDGLHPNATGHEYISWKIQRFLESL